MRGGREEEEVRGQRGGGGVGHLESAKEVPCKLVDEMQTDAIELGVPAGEGGRD